MYSCLVYNASNLEIFIYSMNRSQEVKSNVPTIPQGEFWNKSEPLRKKLRKEIDAGTLLLVPDVVVDDTANVGGMKSANKPSTGLEKVSNLGSRDGGDRLAPNIDTQGRHGGNLITTLLMELGKTGVVVSDPEVKAALIGLVQEIAQNHLDEARSYNARGRMKRVAGMMVNLAHVRETLGLKDLSDKEFLQSVIDKQRELEGDTTEISEGLSVDTPQGLATAMTILSRGLLPTLMSVPAIAGETADFTIRSTVEEYDAKYRTLVENNRAIVEAARAEATGKVSEAMKVAEANVASMELKVAPIHEEVIRTRNKKIAARLSIIPEVGTELANGVSKPFEGGLRGFFEGIGNLVQEHPVGVTASLAAVNYLAFTTQNIYGIAGAIFFDVMVALPFLIKGAEYIKVKVFKR